MEENTRKQEYLKKVESKKLKKFQEFKVLSFSAGVSLIISLLLFFTGYNFITGNVNSIVLTIAIAYMVETVIQYIVLSSIKKQIINTGKISTSTRRLGILFILFTATGNIFATITGFNFVKEEKTLEYTMSVYSVINVMMVILVTSLNLFKEYVSNTFILGLYILIGMLVFYIFSMVMISKYQKGDKIDKKLVPIAVVLIATVISGNVFAFVTGLILVTKFRHKDQDRSIGWIDIMERLFRNNMAAIGMLIVVFLISLSLTSTITFDYALAIDNNYSVILQPVSLEYPFGTDNYGRCVFTRIVFGARISLIVGLCVTVLPMILGGSLGAIAGFYGGRTDNIIMRILDVQYAIPDILLAIAIIAAFGANTFNLIIALSIGSVAMYARTVRATVLGLSGAEFVEAARACGARDYVIIFKHIIPNSLAPIIVRATMGIGIAVLSTSSLSYLGLGVEPFIPEWGNVLKVGSKYLETNPYLAIFPGLAIIILVLAFNFFGDGLRDALDPKMK